MASLTSFTFTEASSCSAYATQSDVSERPRATKKEKKSERSGERKKRSAYGDNFAVGLKHAPLLLGRLGAGGGQLLLQRHDLELMLHLFEMKSQLRAVLCVCCVCRAVRVFANLCEVSPHLGELGGEVVHLDLGRGLDVGDILGKGDEVHHLLLDLLDQVV